MKIGRHDFHMSKEVLAKSQIRLKPRGEDYCLNIVHQIRAKGVVKAKCCRACLTRFRNSKIHESGRI